MLVKLIVGAILFSGLAIPGCQVAHGVPTYMFIRSEFSEWLRHPNVAALVVCAMCNVFLSLSKTARGDPMCRVGFEQLHRTNRVEWSRLICEVDESKTI